ncbi:hypothetical protein ACPA9J_32210 [Pseudomonas aeruginosa]
MKDEVLRLEDHRQGRQAIQEPLTKRYKNQLSRLKQTRPKTSSRPTSTPSPSPTIRTPVPVAGQRGKLRHQHEPLAGRHRRGAAERQRLRQGRTPGAGRPGGEEQADRHLRQDHRRSPGQGRNGRRGWLAPGLSGQADPWAERFPGTPGE